MPTKQLPDVLSTQVARHHRKQDDEPLRSRVSHPALHNRLDLPYAPAIAQGIPLVPVTELPDRLRTVFPFPVFNAVQSKCFKQVYKSEDNFVLSSPTGSGKTAILELAICRAIDSHATGQYKIVYQAPTKSLCSERLRDWQKKFTPLGLECVELTGDSDSTNLRTVQSANVVITTPEKWDSVTRKWKDHEKLMRLIRLFLIDEVHILKDERGSTLEAVVSRMKSMGTNVRFVALSATVPNFEDVAIWVGKNTAEPYESAVNQNFGEGYRPVKLRKHVCGYQSNGNDFVFDKVLDSKLPEVIAKYSARKPIMIFCFTRNSTISTAKMLANWWTARSPRDRYWGGPFKPLNFLDSDLRNCAASGVAFHHAGLDAKDRLGVEDGFLKGNLNVICCTSTLAVGVNLPCHFVIIKNTVSWTNTGIKEYADLEIMQMLGRAGRPQFDDSAIAVIMTRLHKSRRYELMVTGQELLESSLHLNLIDHLNAEIGLRTINSLASAKKWLAGTFLYVRLKQNPDYYKLEGARSGQDVDEQLDDICNRDITLLQETNLVTDDECFRCTEFGDAMARYYVQFETMRAFMGIPSKAKISEILSALAQAAEFREVRFRSGEKPFYKNLNKSPYIRFSIPVDLALPAHKVSLILQSVLGAVDLDWNDQTSKHRPQYTTEVAVIFKHVHRLIRCIIDCQISLEDSVAIRNALMLERSLGARAWDDSPLQMKQVEQLGTVAVRKLTNAGIRTMEELENTEPQRIETILSRNPPFGHKTLDRLKLFPKLRVSVHVLPSSVCSVFDGAKIQVKVEIGFMNERPAIKYRDTLVYVCVLAETSDGRKIHFARISGQKLGNGQDLIIPVLLTDANQCVNCYVMCDQIAGTMREATVKPKVPSSMFPTPKLQEISLSSRVERPTPNMSRRRMEGATGSRRPSGGSDEFGDDGIDDSDLVQIDIGDLEFDHIENYANPSATLTRKNTAKNSSTKGKGREKAVEEHDSEPRQLENGKWACNHKCKDKKACKHMCCREGLDKPPKKTAKKPSTVTDAPSQLGPKKVSDKQIKTQTKLQLPISKRKSSTFVEVLDLTQQEKKRKTKYATNGPRDYQNLHKLHSSVLKRDPPSSISSFVHKKPAYCYVTGGKHTLSFLEKDSLGKLQGTVSSDYGDVQFDELSSHFDHPESIQSPEGGDMHLEAVNGDPIEEALSDGQPESFGDKDTLFGNAIVGLTDSQDLHPSNKEDDEYIRALQGSLDVDYDHNVQNEGFTAPEEVITSEQHQLFWSEESVSSSTIKPRPMPPEKRRSSFMNDTSSPRPQYEGFKSAKSMLAGRSLEEMGLVKGEIRKPRTAEVYEVEQDENGCVDFSESAARDGDESPAVIMPNGYKDLEPWLFAEFGDIIELI
ncbi:P-loop containing nucleoside triphosphate hydrolase protein [Zopfia rhizophila CBS 207.26]|uniref:DNA 3'-5' helicase n=1 Tax=Zopfia rhizophila CBS 207.26 TaxID=1314779 RepID=A0A6A6ER53_9PEZI|nr:P-loop containing nucleoside triphosphate hydrolase protein [Zopfia rhizophila CBS 207.26]